ncbi:MAG: hypothetical protein PHU14_16965 [Methylovulum sp.]|nr:hypothetical protein [Methylovulum sp.]
MTSPLHFTSRSLLLALLLPGLAFGIGQTTQVSTDTNGVSGNKYSSDSAISTDGRFVVFASAASNLVSGDTNQHNDIFVKDRQSGQVTLASISSLGQQGLSDSYNPWISQDGKLVVFTSNAWNLAAGGNGLFNVYFHDMTHQTTTVLPVAPDSFGHVVSVDQYSVSADGRFVAYQSSSKLPHSGCHNQNNIFIYDRQTAKTECVSANANGEGGNNYSAYPAISADGNFISFTSFADNLVPNDTNNTGDIFVRNRITGELSRASVNSNNEESIDTSGLALGSLYPAISADGRWLAFSSTASNLVDGDTNDKRDIFVRDRLSGTTRRVNVSTAGNEATDDSYGTPSISADGRFVAFRSLATNLVVGDTNGYEDSFVHDVKTGITSRESVTSQGHERARGGGTYGHALSADGRWLAFVSRAKLLTAHDTNKTIDVYVRDRFLDTHQNADVALALTGPSSVALNTQAVYTLTVTNNGNRTADNATVISHFSHQGSLKAISTGQGSCNRAAVSVCRLDSLAPGQSVNITATVDIKGAATIDVSANAAAVDSDLGNNTQSLAVTVQ